MSLDQAMARYEAGDRVAAKAAAEAFLGGKPKAAPGHGDALNLLAIIAQDEGRQTEAGKLARKAVTLFPPHPLYLNTLGNGLLALGRSDEAVTVLKAAHAAVPEQADILFNLGNAQRQAGMLDDAVASFRATTALRPSHIGAYNNAALVLKSIGDAESAADAAL